MNPHQHPIHARNTGRTSRMIEEARRLSKEGMAVYIFAASRQERDRIESLIGPGKHGIKVEFPPPRNFDWPRMRHIGAHPNCECLVDHRAIESSFGAMLEMLHRFEADPPVKPLDGQPSPEN